MLNPCQMDRVPPNRSIDQIGLRPERPFTGVSEPSGPENAKKSLKKSLKSMSNRCQIDTKSTPDEGRARRIRGWGLGGLCLINPSMQDHRRITSKSIEPKEASTLIFKIRSCTVRSDLKTKHESSRKCLIFKIHSYDARSDL